jgi:uncharacterized protein YbjT (DUF2867 family)
MSDPAYVGVLGATSIVGGSLLPLLAERSGGVWACSRSATGRAATAGVGWGRPGDPPPTGWEPIRRWIALCPLWTLPKQFAWLERCGVERLVALSSTSRDTKAASPERAERLLAARLAAAEEALEGWSQATGVAVTILRPTMIYDGVNDGNVAAIAAFVRRYGVFPLCGNAAGLRQPVHAADVARACLAAGEKDVPGRDYTLSGGEALPFHELVTRTCQAQGLALRTVRVPAPAWQALAGFARLLGVAQPLAGIGRRMNEDLSVGHEAAAAELGFQPRPFVPGGGTLAAAAGIVDMRPNQPRNQR